MSAVPRPDRPTRADQRRAVAARLAARAAVVAADLAARERAYRAELAVRIRSASPLLLALLRKEGLTPDEVVARLPVPVGWPYSSRTRWTPRGPHAVCHGFVALDEAMPRPPGLRLPLECGAVAEVLVDRHSLEVDVWMDGAALRTSFGLLEIVLPGTLPGTVAAQAVDLPVAALVDHHLLRGWDWRVAAVEVAAASTAIVCRVGAVPYKFGGRR